MKININKLDCFNFIKYRLNIASELDVITKSNSSIPNIETIKTRQFLNWHSKVLSQAYLLTVSPTEFKYTLEDSLNVYTLFNYFIKVEHIFKFKDYLQFNHQFYKYICIY